MGIFNTLCHRKNSHVTMISALPNKKSLSFPGTTRVSSISAGVTVLNRAQLQPFTSNKTCFGWPETALDTEGEEEACGMKSSDQACQRQQKAVSHVNRPQHKRKESSKKWQWETGLQLLIQLSAKLISMPGLMEVQRCLWPQPWQVSAGDQRDILFLKTFGACLTCHEDQGHADIHPGNS